MGLSYRYAWGMLREAEHLFGQRLLDTGRGRGTALTPLAQKLVWADRRIAARLSPTLDSLASELETELGKVSSRTLRTIRMDASHGFAVAALTAYLNRSSCRSSCATAPAPTPWPRWRGANATWPASMSRPAVRGADGWPGTCAGSIRRSTAWCTSPGANRACLSRAAIRSASLAWPT